MSQIRSILNQIGLSSTPEQNFTLTAEQQDGTMQLWRGPQGGYTQKVLEVDANGYIHAVTPPVGDSSDMVVTTEWLADSTGYIGRLLGIQIFISSGTYTPSVGAKKIVIEACGGGGGGGSAAATVAGQSSAGTGGSASDYVRTPLIDPGIYDIVIGVGGSGGTSSSATSGGATTVGSIVSCRGGNLGGSGAASSTGYTSNTSGGTSGTLVFPPGSVVVPVGLGPRGVVIAPGTPSGQVAGSGGTGPLGRGGDGPQNANGNDAPGGYGGGGSAGANSASGALKSGGNGSQGIVIIKEYA